MVRSASYTYDVSHNRIGLSVTGTDSINAGYEYDLGNRLTREFHTDASGVGVTEYVYDDNGKGNSGEHLSYIGVFDLIEKREIYRSEAYEGCDIRILLPIKTTL